MIKKRFSYFVIFLFAATLRIGFCNPNVQKADFAGMVCIPLTSTQLNEVDKYFGERCGVGISEVKRKSMAGLAGVLSGDILLSVRMPDEDDFYTIPPEFDDMAQFAEETEPINGIRLLILRRDKGALRQMVIGLGNPPTSVATEKKPTPSITKGALDKGISSSNFSFASSNLEKVVARAQDGSSLTQSNVDIFGGVMAWSFGTRLTEAQKVVIRSSLKEFWTQATADNVQMFRRGILSTPDLLPRLPAGHREKLRTNFANVFLQMAQSLGQHPLAQVIWTVSAGARNVLAGGGTDAELTLQDIHALLEYQAFMNQIQTGQGIMITPQQRYTFVNQVLAYYKQAGKTEKKVLAAMDERWAVLRARWAAAAAARQQAVAQQWQQVYAQQQATGWYSPFQRGWQEGGAAGGEMSNSQFNTMMNSMNTLHDSSLQTLGAIDGEYDFEVYDSAGQWLYEY